MRLSLLKKMKYIITNYFKKFYIGFIFSISLIYLYPMISHGDHEFYELVYDNNKLIFDNPFFLNDMLTGWIAEPFFGFLLILAPKLFSYDFLNFILDIILFTSLAILLKKYLKRDVLVFLVILCCNYFFVLALSSIRSELVLIFFTLSVLKKDDYLLFFIFYFLSFLTHVGLAIFFYSSFFIIFFRDTKITKKLTILKIILILSPIFYSSPLAFAKIVGYNDQNQKELKSHKIQIISKEILIKKKKELELLLSKERAKLSKYKLNSAPYKLVQKRINLYLLEYNQILNKIEVFHEKSDRVKNSEILKSENFLQKIKNELNYSLKFKLIDLDILSNNFLIKKDLLIPNFSIVFNMTIYTFIILCSFNLFLLLLGNNIKNVFIHFIIFVPIYGIIGFSKGSLVLFLVSIFFLLNNFENLKKFNLKILLIFIFLTPFLLKNVFMINNLIIYGRLF